MSLEQREYKLKKIVAALNSCAWYDDEDILASLGSTRKHISLQRAISKIREINPILKEQYGENYHIELILDVVSIDEKDEYEIVLIGADVIIHYPTIEITNTDEDKHTIRDLFVKIEMMSRRNELIPLRIHGLRTTFTPEEFVNNYRHSHLPRQQLRKANYSVFCIGDGELSKLFTLMAGDGVMEAEIFILLIYTIDTFVAWESIEGGPYIRINNIKGIQPVEYDYVNAGNCNFFYGNLKHHYKTKNKRAQLSFTFQNGKYVLIKDTLFENYIMYLGNTDYTKYNCACIIAENNQAYKIQFNYSESKFANAAKWTYKFKDKEFPCTIIDAEVPLNNFSIFPKVKDYVKQQIEQTINRRILEENISTKITSIVTVS